MQLHYLLVGLNLSPVTVERIVARVPEGAYNERRDPDRFTFREAVAHLADWEPINLERIQAGVVSPGSTVMGLDEAQRAVERDYAATDPREQAQLFTARRAATMFYLRTLSDEDCAKINFHSERGRQTVLEQAVSMLGHDVYHLEQFSEYL